MLSSPRKSPSKAKLQSTATMRGGRQRDSESHMTPPKSDSSLASPGRKRKNSIKEEQDELAAARAQIQRNLLQLATSSAPEQRLPLERVACEQDVQLFLEAERLLKERNPELARRPSPAPSPHGDLEDQCEIKNVYFGKYCIDSWYGSPYPHNLSKRRQIYVCEFCLKPLETETVFRRHTEKCVWRHPPGNEIYHDAKTHLSVWEIEGYMAKTYCQSLCLLAKLWLQNKTLYFDVDPFFFYVLTKEDEEGCKLTGYFSKEKGSEYNLSCIMVLPPYMRSGYGRMLIDFSYLLTRQEGKTGSPEGPLSDLGLMTYRRYWEDVILDKIATDGDTKSFSLKAVSQATGIHINDVVSTLQYKGMIKYYKGKYMLYKNLDLFQQRYELSGMLEGDQWHQVEQKWHGHINSINFSFIPRTTPPEIILHEDGRVESPDYHQILAFYESDDRALAQYCLANGHPRFIPGQLHFAVCECEGCQSAIGPKVFNFIKNVHLGNVGIFEEENGKRDGALLSMTRDSAAGALGGPRDVISSIFEGLQARRENEMQNEIGNVKLYGVKVFGDRSRALFGRGQVQPPLTRVAYSEMEMLCVKRNSEGMSKLCVDYEEYREMRVEGRFERLMNENGRNVPGGHGEMERIPFPIRLRGMNLFPYLTEVREHYSWSSMAHQVNDPKNFPYRGFVREDGLLVHGQFLSSSAAGPSHV